MVSVCFIPFSILKTEGKIFIEHAPFQADKISEFSKKIANFDENVEIRDRCKGEREFPGRYFGSYS